MAGFGSLPDTWRYEQGLYFSWAELSSLPVPSSSRSLHRWKISFSFWQNSKAVQRRTCLGTESGGIGLTGKRWSISFLILCLQPPSSLPSSLLSPPLTPHCCKKLLKIVTKDFSLIGAPLLNTWLTTCSGPVSLSPPSPLPLSSSPAPPHLPYPFSVALPLPVFDILVTQPSLNFGSWEIPFYIRNVH